MHSAVAYVDAVRRHPSLCRKGHRRARTGCARADRQVAVWAALVTVELLGHPRSDNSEYDNGDIPEALHGTKGTPSFDAAVVVSRTCFGSA